MSRPAIIDIRSANRSQVPAWGNTHQYIVVHYLGVKNADNPYLYGGGYGGHYNITRDGRIWWAADHDAVLWQVGTAGYYTQKHPYANNYNCIGIEVSVGYDSDWYYTQASEDSLIQLVQYLMDQLGIPVDRVLRHYDVVNKLCPINLVGGPGDLGAKHNGRRNWAELKQAFAGGDDLSLLNDWRANTRIYKTVCKFMTVTADGVNLRMYPSVNAPTARWDHLNKGSVVLVVGYGEGDEWAKVVFNYGADGAEGWIHTNYLA